jgi:hypothetical protein
MSDSLEFTISSLSEDDQEEWQYQTAIMDIEDAIEEEQEIVAELNYFKLLQEAEIYLGK